MKKILLSFFLTTLFLVSFTVYASKNTPSDWTLVWSDEFDGKTVNTSEWDYEIGYIRNNEEQYYTNRPENAKIVDGNLVIQARREEYDYYEYTSASLFTKRKFQYGRFELRARIPCVSGSWPAWWALGTGNDGKWPECGEIDMMEYYKGKILANVYFGTYWYSDVQMVDGFKPGWESQYHIWIMEWDAHAIKLFCDGKLALHFDVNEATRGEHNPFRLPMYMIVNLAIGGSNGGDPTGTEFPLDYYIDYIRVYQKQK